MSAPLEYNENYAPCPRRADSIKTASSQGLGTPARRATDIATNVNTRTTLVPATSNSQDSFSTIPLLARTNSIPSLQDTSKTATNNGEPGNGDAAGPLKADSSSSSELVEMKMYPRAPPRPHENTIVPLSQAEALQQALLAARQQARQTSRDDQFLPDAQATGDLSPPEFDNVDTSAQEVRAQDEWENQQAETRTSISHEIAQSQARHTGIATATVQTKAKATSWDPAHADAAQGDSEKPETFRQALALRTLQTVVSQTENEVPKKRKEQWENEAESSGVKSHDPAQDVRPDERLPKDHESAGSMALDEN